MNQEKNMSKDINLNILTNKINELYDDAFKSIYEIVKNNDETVIKTKNYYLVNLDNVSTKTIVELNNFINYLDASFNHLTDIEQEKNRLRNELSDIDVKEVFKII
jgi:hydrogenase maturation factor